VRVMGMSIVCVCVYLRVEMRVRVCVCERVCGCVIEREGVGRERVCMIRVHKNVCPAEVAGRTRASHRCGLAPTSPAHHDRRLRQRPPLERERERRRPGGPRREGEVHEGAGRAAQQGGCLIRRQLLRGDAINL
jgi:hypothetical protein